MQSVYDLKTYDGALKQVWNHDNTHFFHNVNFNSACGLRISRFKCTLVW